jgi:hypothetical protein
MKFIAFSQEHGYGEITIARTDHTTLLERRGHKGFE